MTSHTAPPASLPEGNQFRPASPLREYAIIAVAALVSHFMAFGRGFVWDDVKTIQYFTFTGAWKIASPDPFGFIRPGKMFLFSALHSVFGERAWGYEAVALLTVVATGIVMFPLLRTWLSSRAALLASLVYVCHPHQVESAFWISALNGALLTLAALAYYRVLLDAAQSFTTMRFAALNFLYLLALSMKEEAVVLPVIGALMLFSQGRRPVRWMILMTAAHAVVSLLFVAYGRMIAKQIGQTLDPQAESWVLSASAPRMMLSHILYFFSPFQWSYYHTFSTRSLSLFSMMALGFVFLAAALIWIFSGERFRDPRRLGLAIALVAFLPVSNLLPMQNNWFGVRYLSHAGVGLVLLIGAQYDRMRSIIPRPLPLIHAALALWLLACTVMSNVFHTSWSDSAEFFERTLAEERNPVFLSLLGNLRLKDKKYAEGLDLIEESIALDPSRVVNYVSQGIALARLGRSDEALAAWTRAESMNPNDVDNSIQLAFYYDGQYEKSRALGDRDKADHYYRIALRGLSENSAVAFANLGLLWMMEGEYDKAVSIWKEGNRRFPAFEGISANLDRALRDPRAKKGVSP